MKGKAEQTHTEMLKSCWTHCDGGPQLGDSDARVTSPLEVACAPGSAKTAVTSSTASTASRSIMAALGRGDARILVGGKRGEKESGSVSTKAERTWSIAQTKREGVCEY